MRKTQPLRCARTPSEAWERRAVGKQRLSGRSRVCCSERTLRRRRLVRLPGRADAEGSAPGRAEGLRAPERAAVTCAAVLRQTSRVCV